MKWQGEPLIVEVPHDSGLFTYSLHPHLVAYEHLAVSEQHPTPPPNLTENNFVSKRRIVAHSRHRYARPRTEVERLVAAQPGNDSEEPDEQRKLRARLENTGVTTEQAKDIITNYNGHVIAQQLDWLPFRHAKNPAGYLLAATEGDYSEPRGVREGRLLRELQYDAIQFEGLPTEEPSAAEDFVQLHDRNERPLDSEGASRGGVTQGRAASGDASFDAEIATLAADGQTIDLTPEP